MKTSILIFLSILFVQCTSNSELSKPVDIENDSDPKKTDLETINSTEVLKELSTMQKVDSMLNTHDFSIDTNRLKQVYLFSHIQKNKINDFDNLISYEVPFPNENIEHHFSNSKTYFYVKKGDSIQKFGIDYLIQTWELDSIAEKYEIEIMFYLKGYHGNFPVYSFLDGNKLYSIVNRQTICDQFTSEFCTLIRDVVNPNAKIYGYKWFHENNDRLRMDAFNKLIEN